MTTNLTKPMSALPPTHLKPDSTIIKTPSSTIERNTRQNLVITFRTLCNNVDFNIKWKALKQVKPYNNTSNRCNLCL